MNEQADRVNEQAEDPSREASAATRASSFSSSLGPHPGTPGTADGTPGADGSASSHPGVDTDSVKTQLGNLVSDVSSKLASLTDERPEVVIGAAFVGGLMIATILKRLAR